MQTEDWVGNADLEFILFFSSDTYLGRDYQCVDCMLKSSRGQAQRRTQMRGLPMWRLLMLFRGSPRCEHFGFLIQVAFSEVRKCELRLLFY